jgi:2,3-dihydroxy-2,3-dihydro-p-cumate dehydrogenase
MTQQFKSLEYEVPCQCQRYDGRVAIVTGAAQGLGRVIAKRLAQEGATVVLADIQEERVKRTAAQLQDELGSPFLGIGGDLSVPGVADDVARQAVDAFGQIDVLVNNAAYLVRMPFLDFTEEIMQRHVAWNLWSPLRMCRAVLPYMLDRKYGRIVNIGGEHRIGTPMHTLLAGVKSGGIEGVTATLAADYLTEGIRVNCVSPAGMETLADGDPEPLPREQDPAVYPEQTAWQEWMRSGQAGPGSRIGRPAHPTEVAAVVAFLGSHEASYMTGQTLHVNGGAAMMG